MRFTTCAVVLAVTGACHCGGARSIDAECSAQPPAPDVFTVASDWGRFPEMAARVADIPRPWTFEKLAAEYVSALLPERREALIYLLVASGDKRGLIVAGEALEGEKEMTRVKITAAQAMEAGWMEGEGGYWSAVDEVMVASRWWEERRSELLAAERQRYEELKRQGSPAR